MWKIVILLAFFWKAENNVKFANVRHKQIV